MTLLVGAVVALAAISLAAFPPPGFSRAVVRFLASFPPFLDGLWQVLADLLVVLALLLLVAAIVRRRGSIVRDMLLAVGLAIAGWLLVGRAVAGSWPDLWDGLHAAQPPPWYPSPRIALPAAAVITASPHLTRPMRQLGRWVVVSAVVAVAVLGATTPASSSTTSATPPGGW